MPLGTLIRVKPRYALYLLRGRVGHFGLFGGLNAPVLLVGAPNSGTRILAQAIARHPAIEDKSELRLLWDKDFHRKDTDTLKTADDVRRKDIIRLQGNFCYYQWVSGKALILNRHPENSLRIHFMKNIFPSAKIIHIVRDGRAVICSNYRSATSKAERIAHPFGGYIRPPGWRKFIHRPVLEQLAYMWNSTVLYAATEGRKYAEDFLEVFYEDLQDGQKEILPRIWAWLGLSFTHDLLEKLPRFESRNDKWRSELAESELCTIETIAGEALRHFGYLPGKLP